MNYKIEVVKDTYEILADENTNENCWEFVGMNCGREIIGIVAKDRNDCLDYLKKDLLDKEKDLKKQLAKVHKLQRKLDE